MRLAKSVPRFALVGVVATFIHAAVAVGIVEMLDWHPSFANGIAFVIANIFSYASNTRWSFDAKYSMGSWYRFVSISFIAWLMTIAVSWVVEIAGGSYLLGILFVITLIPALSYAGHRNFTYR